MLVFEVKTHKDSTRQEAFRSAITFSNHNNCVVKLEIENIVLEIKPFSSSPKALEEELERHWLIKNRRESADTERLLMGGLGNPYE